MLAISDDSILEISIDGVHAAMRDGELTAKSLVQVYIDRISKYDKSGPAINSIISLNESALAEAEALDAAFKKSGRSGHFTASPSL